MAVDFPELTGSWSTLSTVSEKTNGNRIRKRRTPLSRVFPTRRVVHSNRSLSLFLPRRRRRRRQWFRRLCSLTSATMVDHVIDENVADAQPKPVALPYAPFVPAQHNPFAKGDHRAVYDPAGPVGRRFRTYDAQPERTPKMTPRPEDAQTEVDKSKSNKKSPIYFLNEIMSCQGKHVEYDMISMTGKVHCPEFMVRAKCDGIVVCGTGMSKKEARKNAAVAFLDQLHNTDPNNDITSTTSNHLLCSTIDHKKNVLETITELNPIGVLQELCMARRWQLPKYEVGMKDLKNSHNPGCYIVICSLQAHKSKGEGKTKQAAKHQAARFMYDKILHLSQEETTTPSVDNNYQVPIEALLSSNKSTLDFATLMTKPTISNTLNCVEMFFNQLKLSTNPFINNLQRFNSISEFGMSSVDVLNKIGDEEGFNVSYIEIAKKTEKSEVLVQVSIIPLLVNIGTGDTLKKAQEMAAYCALLYIKMLLEK